MVKKTLEDSWEHIRPQSYGNKKGASGRDVGAATVAGLSVVTVAESLQWVVDVAVPGDFALPYQPAVVVATLLGVWYARRFKA